MRPLLIAACVALTVAAVPARSQAPDQSSDPTFRGGVDFVRVDMYASRDGAPITDLRADEIEIREDGTLQTIESFEHVSVSSGGPEAARIQPNSVRASRQIVDDARARVFVIFVDTYHFDAQFSQQMQTPLRRFLEEALGPDDLVALVTPEMDVSDLTFGRKTTVLSEFFSETIEWMKRDIDWVVLDDTEQQYRECYPADSTATSMIRRRREKLTLDALESLSRYLGLIREERKTVVLPTMGWTLFEPDQALADAEPRDGVIPIAPIDRITRGRGPTGQGQTTRSMQVQCDADRLALARLDHRNRLREIIGAANRANVSFYPITPLRNPAFAGERASLGRLAELRGLAEDTDGMAVVNTNNIAPAMQRIIDDSSSYYLLGYQSSKAPDGSYRSISVTVARPGVEVRARRGYRSVPALEARLEVPDSPASARPRPDEAVTRAFNDVARAQTPAPLRIRGSAWTRTVDGGTAGRLWIVGELDAATRRAPDWRSGARAELSVLTPGGGQTTRAVDVAAGAFAFAVDLSDGGAPLLPGAYDVRVSLRAGSGGGAGESLAETVRIDVPSAASPLGEAVLLRRIGTQPHVVTADPRFRRNERLRLELPTASPAAVEARVIDRAGQETPVPAEVTERTDPSGDFRWIVVDVVLAPFAFSDYAVAVTQDEVTTVTAFRIVQ
jgi:VWFA-related protein